jgi:hypothetical protein
MPLSTAVTCALIPIAQNGIDGDVTLTKRRLLILDAWCAMAARPGIRLQPHLRPTLSRRVKLNLTPAVCEVELDLMLLVLVNKADGLAAEAQQDLLISSRARMLLVADAYGVVMALFFPVSGLAFLDRRRSRCPNHSTISSSMQITSRGKMIVARLRAAVRERECGQAQILGVVDH